LPKAIPVHGTSVLGYRGYFLFCVCDTGFFNSGYLLGRHSTTSVMPPALFSLVILEIGSCVYAWTSLEHDPPIYISHVAVMTGVCHHALLYWLT
jgi:hypothetical protein